MKSKSNAYSTQMGPLFSLFSLFFFFQHRHTCVADLRRCPFVQRLKMRPNSVVPYEYHFIACRQAGRQAGKQAKNLILLHVETIMYYAVN